MPRGKSKDSPEEVTLNDLLPDIYKFSLYLTGNFHDAEDVAQNVCLKFLKYRKSYDPRKGGLLFYIQRLTVNEANTLLSRRKTHLPEEILQLLPAGGSGSDDRAEERNTATVILSLLTDLTAREREIFVMREVMEMAYGDIAESLDISQVTARRFYSMARKKLREMLLNKHPEYSHLIRE